MVQKGVLKKGNVVKFDDGKDLKESRLAKFKKIDGSVMTGKIIYPLNELGQLVFWGIARVSIISENEYRPLLEK